MAVILGALIVLEIFNYMNAETMVAEERALVKVILLLIALFGYDIYLHVVYGIC